jgi:hypothetical protein
MKVYANSPGRRLALRLYTKVSRHDAQRESFADKLDGMSLLASCIDDSYAAKGGSTVGQRVGPPTGVGPTWVQKAHFGRPGSRKIG